MCSPESRARRMEVRDIREDSIEHAKEPKKHLCVDEAMHNNLYDYNIEKNVINFNS